VLSGALAARGEISLVGMLVFAWIGAVLGDSVGHWIGRKAGRGLLIRYGALVGLTHERFAKIEAVYARYGPVTVAFARFFNILRQLNGVVAGTAGMAWPQFVLFNMIGAFLWVGTWGFGAYYFADHASSLPGFIRHIGPWGIAGLAAAGAVAVGLVVMLARRRSAVGGSRI
jgi:membrane protein DedA with SNARE-associated domain